MIEDINLFKTNNQKKKSFYCVSIRMVLCRVERIFTLKLLMDHFLLNIVFQQIGAQCVLKEIKHAVPIQFIL
jgi:hypothetical protein